MDLTDTSPAEARQRLMAAIDEGANGIELAYEFLSDWVWTALTDRRLDSGLRDWHGLLLDLAAEVAAAAPVIGAALDALARLVQRSIALGERNPIEKVSERPNVKLVLKAIGESGGAYCPRSALLKRTGLGQANLSRILSILSAHNLIDRRQDGRGVLIRLTRRGEAVIGAVRVQKPVRISAAEQARTIIRHTKNLTGMPSIFGLERREATLSTADPDLFVAARIDPMPVQAERDVKISVRVPQ